MALRDTVTSALGSVLNGALGLVTDVMRKASSPDDEGGESDVGSMALTVAGQGSEKIPPEPTDNPPKGLLYDPFALIDQLGFRDRPSGLTYATLRETAKRVPTVMVIEQTRLTQVSGFATPQSDKRDTGFEIKLRDEKASPSKEDKRRMLQLTDWMLNTGSTWGPGRDDFKTFLRKLTRDTLELDQGCFEVVRNRKGTPAEFYCLDGATIRLADVPPGAETEANPDVVKYVQVYDEIIIGEFSAADMCFGVRNPRSDIRVNGYGFSEIEMLISVVTASLWAYEYNKKFFSQGTAAKGILNFKGSVPDSKIDCLPYGTLIQTHRGTFPIGKAFEMQSERGVRFKMWDGRSFLPGTVHEAGIKDLIKIVLEDGSSIRESDNHRMFVLTDTGIDERFASDLAVGDALLQNNKVVECEDLPLETREWKGIGRGTGRDFSIESIGEDLWEVIGWQVGDGWLSNSLRNMLLFYHAEKDLGPFQTHGETLKKYGVNFKEIPRAGGVRVWQICHKAFSEFLISIGILAGAHKTVPWLVFAQTSAKRAAFLRGLFSADGYVSSHGYQVGITSVYPDLIDGMQDLLNTLGLVSYRNKHSHENAVQLFVERRELFKERIGFCQKYKMDKIAPVKDAARTPGDVVPIALLRNLLEPHRDDEGMSFDLRRAVLSVINRNHSARILSRNYWRAVFESWGDTRAVEMLSYHPVRIKQICDGGIEETYDVSIAEGFTPRFIAGGLLSHNSFRRQWQMMLTGVNNAWRTPMTNTDELQWINLSQNNRDMEYSAWMDWLIKVTCACYQLDPAEINFTYGNAGQTSQMFSTPAEQKIKQSKDRGLRPLLDDIAQWLNVNLIWRIDPRYKLVFVGLDAKSAGDSADLGKKRVTYLQTVDELRAEDDLAPLPDGKGDCILDPTWLQFAQAKDQAKQQQAGPPGPMGEPPMGPNNAAMPGAPQQEPPGQPSQGPVEGSDEQMGAIFGGPEEKPEEEEKSLGHGELRKSAPQVRRTVIKYELDL